MKKKIIENILEVILIILLVICVGNHIAKYLGENSVGTTSSSVAAFHKLPKNSTDVIIYGSSHAWKGMDAVEMYNKYGLSTYNYGCNWQNFNSTYMYICDSFRTQNPKVLVVELYKVDQFLTDTDLTGEILYSKYVPGFDEKRKYLKDCFGNDLGRYITYYFNLAAFHDSWNSLNEDNFTRKLNTERWLATMGSSLSEDVKKVNIRDWRTFTQSELPAESIEYLDSIVTIAKQNNADVIFYVAPMSKEFAYHNAMVEYAEANECAFLDFFELFDEAGLDSEKDFQNGTHLNAWGSKKMADYMGQYITDNYDLRDSRGITDN